MPPKPKEKNDVSVAASRIEELRNRLGLTQTAFAARIGTLPSSVSKWEAGRNRPTPEIFARLSRIAEGKEKAFFLGEAGISEYVLKRVPSADQKESETLDPELLAQVMAAVETMMLEKRLGFSLPEKAQIVAKVYDEWRNTGQRAADTVDRAIKELCYPKNQKVRT